MDRWLTARWYDLPPRPSPWQPLALLYGALVRARRGAYRAGWLRSGAAGRPVVVVGNLTVGGTGKTPLIIWLAGQLQAQGLRVGVISRGYGRQGRGLRPVRADSDWRAVGDEPLLIARRTGCEVLVSAQRLAAARVLAAQGVEVILSDDGLQHLALRRDFQIAVVDGARGFGNGRLLPAGPLREPLATLPAVDAVVINGEPRHPSLARHLPAGALQMQLQGNTAVNLANGSQRGLADFRGLRVHAVAGIGNPQRFFSALRAQGLDVIEHPFPDHHAFAAAQLDFGGDLPLLMTEKDAVKCTAFARAQWWSVPVSAQFPPSQAQALLGQVLQRLRGCDGHKTAGNSGLPGL